MQRFTGLLTATVLGAYGLFALGATTAATAARSFALGHYVAAALVWLVVAAVTVRAVRGGHDPHIRWGMATILLVYTGQALLGLVGVLGAPVFGVHLLGGVLVFALLLAVLVWHLEREVYPRPAQDDNESGTATGRATGGGIDVTATDDDEPVAGDEMPPAGDSPLRRLRARVGAYVALTKPRLMWLLGLLALAGMALGTVTGTALDGVTVVATLAGGFLAVGSAGTFNHVYERDRDSEMDRTDDRPVATETVGPYRATLFGVALFVASMALLVAVVNVLAAVLTAVAVVYYAVVYTVVLKPSTVWNTVIGGGAGALPAVIGWAAVTGSVGLPAVALAAVVFCWTPAHFYNLAIVYRADYERAGYPMLPVVHGVETTRRRVVYWLGLTLLVATALGVLASFGPVYVGTVVTVGFVFLWTVADQFARETTGAAYRSFHASNAFLGALLLAVVVETLVL